MEARKSNEKITIIDNFDHLIKYIGKFRKTSIYNFRGQSNKDWKLIPKAGRPPFEEKDDKMLFMHWKRRATAYLKRDNYDEWELLAIAQHNGIPTRLLDWTHNPLVAAFFACMENFETDGAIFAYKSTTYIETKSKDPFDFPNGTIKFFMPTASSDRIMNQLGYFTLHSQPTKELTEKIGNTVLEKIIIPHGIKKEIIFALNQFGVNSLSLFPDLDGLTKHLTWFYTNYKYWDDTI